MSSRILLIGPLPTTRDVVGGTKVSFAQQVNLFQQSDRFDVTVLNTSRRLVGRNRLGRAFANAFAFARVLGNLILRGAAHELILWNVSAQGAMRSGPFIWLASRFVRRPLMINLFGGDFALHYDASSQPLRWLVDRTVLRSPLVLFQTRALCERFGQRTASRWYPTNRDYPPAERRAKQCRRFLFMAQLRPEKGIRELLEASSALPPECSLSVFGAPMHGTDMNAISQSKRVTYCGVVDPTNVPRVLEEHDALVFPTYYLGEGIPGVVIEALQSGLPVIATDWGSLLDVVTHEESGLVITPRSSIELQEAMHRLMRDDTIYAKLSQGALDRGRDFRTSYWHQQLESWCLELCTKRQRKGATGCAA